MKFEKASKSKTKLRLALFGVSGGGKSYSALRIATGLSNGGKIAVVDTERGSVSLYADKFNFDVLDLDNKSIDSYVEAIKLAEKSGYEVLIIDSLTHAWQELLDEVDKIARAKYKGNSWAAWNEGTPKYKKLIDSILNFNGHIIATMRSKTEWSVESDGGRNKPVRVGLSPEQRQGIEFEFSMLLEINQDHIAHCIKDRTGKYQDKLIDKPDESFGKEILDWLNSSPTLLPKSPIASKIEPIAIDSTANELKGYTMNWKPL